MKANSLEELVTNSNIAGELRNYTDWHTRLVKFAQLVADWQKEQDQPITGNSLEQEWLRYVDRKKKESRGELPALGEYGWLQIARHFAKWQKQQMLKDAVEGEITKDNRGNNVIRAGVFNKDFEYGDKVRIIVCKKEEE